MRGCAITVSRLLAAAAAADRSWRRLEPGGWGVATFAARLPNSSDWIAGTDVAGVFASDDDGATWAACPALSSIAGR